MNTSTTITPKFGLYLKELRAQKRITLRQFSLAAEADPGNVSRIERGILQPPQKREILERYAAALSLAEGSDEWHTFFDFAAADQGVFPQDLLKNTGIVEFLPSFFRTLRGAKPTREEMKKIIESIRNT